MRILGMVAAVVSALFWYGAARVDTPATFHITITKPLTVSPGDNDLVGVGHSRSLDLLGQELAQQSKLNEWAAKAAACAIFLMEVLPNVLNWFAPPITNRYPAAP